MVTDASEDNNEVVDHGALIKVKQKFYFVL